MRRIALGLVFVSLVFAGENKLTVFFAKFATLFAAEDHKALADGGLVRFPLELKGTLDDSPSVKISAKQFPGALQKIARQSSGLNATNLNETEKEYIAAQAKAGKLPQDAGEGNVRSGNLVFGQKAGKWQLMKVYVSDELVSELSTKR